MAPFHHQQNKKKPSKFENDDDEQRKIRNNATRRYIYLLGAIFVVVAVGTQIYITLTTFTDPRAVLLHKHLDTFNVTSQPTSLPESVLASQVLSLVPGHEFGNIPNQDGAVLGVLRNFKKNDVVMSIPFDALVDPSLPNTFAHLLSQNADWQDPRRKYPRNVMSLAAWVLVEMKKHQQQNTINSMKRSKNGARIIQEELKNTKNPQFAKSSLFENWLEATGANKLLIPSASGNKLNTAHAAANGGESAYYWDMKKSRTCVSDIFTVDFNETISLVPKLQEGLGFICVDDDIAEKYPEAQRLLCRVFDEDSPADNRDEYGKGGVRLLVSEDEIRVALDLVNRRSIMNQALVPVFDFSEVSLRQNVGLRADSINKRLVVFALHDLPANTPIRFQRFLGKWDVYMRTGYTLPTLGLEAINGKLMMGGSKTNEELMQKFCHERMGHLIFRDDGSPHSALRECFGLMAILGPEREGLENLPSGTRKLLKAVKARYAADARKELEMNAELRKWAAGNLTKSIERKLKMLTEEGEAMLANDPYCARFEDLRHHVIDIYTKAIEKLKTGHF